MDRRTLLTTSLLTSVILGLQAVTNLKQKAVDTYQNQRFNPFANDLTVLSEDQKKLGEEQADLRKSLDMLPDLMHSLAMQTVLLRVACDMLSIDLQIPYTVILELMLAAQDYTLRGGDPLAEGFWYEVIENYLTDNPQAEAAARLMAEGNRGLTF